MYNPIQYDGGSLNSKLLVHLVLKSYVLGFQIPKDEVLLEPANAKGDANSNLNEKIRPISVKGNFGSFTLHWHINTFYTKVFGQCN